MTENGKLEDILMDEGLTSDVVDRVRAEVREIPILKNDKFLPVAEFTGVLAGMVATKPQSLQRLVDDLAFVVDLCQEHGFTGHDIRTYIRESQRIAGRVLREVKVREAGKEDQP